MKLRVPEGLGAVYAQAKTVTKRNLFLVEQKCETKNPGANEVSDAAFTGCCMESISCNEAARQGGRAGDSLRG